MIGREPEAPALLSDRLLARLEHAGRLEIADLAAAELRLMGIRAWLRDMGDSALERLRDELVRSIPSALDVDIVVQQVGYRAALDVAG